MRQGPLVAAAALVSIKKIMRFIAFATLNIVQDLLNHFELISKHDVSHAFIQVH